VLGIFWKRANKWGASLGMIAGLGITFYYMATTQPWLRGIFGVTSPAELWWGIQPISAGCLRRAAGLCGDHHRQPADAGAQARDAGTGRACALPRT
jgi:Na+(H+)/acetate symporter ActP